MNKILTTLLVVATVIGMVIPAMANPQEPVAVAKNVKDLQIMVEGALTSTNAVTQEQNVNGDVTNWALGIGTGGNVNAQSTAAGITNAGNTDSVVNCNGGSGTGNGDGTATGTSESDNVADGTGQATGTGTGAGTGDSTGTGNGGGAGHGGNDNMAEDDSGAGNGGSADAAGSSDASGAGVGEGSGGANGEGTAMGESSTGVAAEGTGMGHGGNGGDCSNSGETMVTSGDVAAMGGNPEGFSGDVEQKNVIKQDATSVIATSQELNQPVTVVDLQGALALDPTSQEYFDSMFEETIAPIGDTNIS